MTRPDRLLVLLCLCSAFTAGGCGTFVPDVGMNPRIDISQFQRIAVYVQPSDDRELDGLYSNLLAYDLVSRGYSVLNLNAVLADSEAGPMKTVSTYLDLVKTIQANPKARGVDAFAVGRVESKKAIFEYESFHYIYRASLPYVDGSLAIVEASKNELAFGLSFQDTCRIFESKNLMYRYEHNRFPLERSLGRLLDSIPICKTEIKRTPTMTIPIVLCVDESYRTFFAADWKARLERRMLYVNDIFYRQFGIEFSLKEFRLWSSHFEYSLDGEFQKLAVAAPQTSSIILGVTLNPTLARDWLLRAKIGLGSYISGMGVFTSQPSYPDLKAWNALDEALTMAHELGHILGSGHVVKSSSLMYPSAGLMAMEFDPISHKIIRALMGDAMRLSGKERAEKQVAVVRSFHTAGQAQSMNILEVLANNLRYLQPAKQQRTSKLFFFPSSFASDSLDPAFVFSQVGDSALTYGILGFTHVMGERWAAADQCLKRAVTLAPRWGEAHELLAATAYALGDRDRQKKHLAEAVRLGRVSID